MSVPQDRFPFPNAKFKTTELPLPHPQYPNFQAVVHDLRREYRTVHPDQVPGEDVEFYLYTGPDGRSASFEARTERTEGQWTIFRHELYEIEDNRVVRRREIEIPCTAFSAE